MQLKPTEPTGSSMIRAVLIYLIALILIWSQNVDAFDYEVDMPFSTSQYEVIRIKIDSCDTFFKIPKKEFEAMRQLPQEVYNRKLQLMIKQAIEHSQTGCK